MSDKSDEKTSKIDAAIAAAKARAAAKAKGETATKTAETKAEKPARAAAKPKLTDEEREARKTKLEAERAERKAAKTAAREKARAEKLAARKPAHMSKVTKAGEKLPQLAGAAQILFGDATANLGRADLASLALHIQHFNRVKATERALDTRIEAGHTVTIVGGDPRFIGKTGTVTKAQRIRCYVEIEGVNKPVYCFTSDVEPLAAADREATGTDA
jgi:flagellar biosynthesis GTPase FlhF